jgi:hypothetical protein
MFKDLDELLSRFAESVIREQQNRLKNAGKVVSGNLGNNLGYSIRNESGKTILQFKSGSDYAPFVDKGVMGTRGVKSGFSFKSPYRFKFEQPSRKMRDAVGKWAQSKGIDQKFVYPICLMIVREGIPPTNFFSNPIQRRTPELKKKLARAFKETILFEIRK